MHFSFSSLANISLFSSILILMLYLYVFFRNDITIIKSKTLLFLLVLILIRYFFPFEFIFTKSLPVESLWTSIYHFFIKNEISLGNFSINFILTFYLIWITGGILLFINLILDYVKTRKTISNFKPESNSLILESLSNLNNNFEKKKFFQIVNSPLLTSPMVFGFHKPYIIIPSINLTSKEWECIFHHELSHFYRGHLQIKLICQLICILYWWNPCIYLLKKMVYEIIEIDADTVYLSSASNQEKIEYLECLLNVCKATIQNNKNLNWAFSFTNRNTLLLTRRSECILCNLDDIKLAKPSLKPVVLSFLFFAYFIFSIFFIIEPAGNVPKEITATTFTFGESGYFFIENEDGSYDLYTNYKYNLTIENLPTEDPTLKIYKSLQEALLYEK